MLKRTIDRMQKVQMLHGLGWTTREIADALNITRSSVADYYKRLGLRPNVPTDPSRAPYNPTEIEMLTMPLCEECIFSDCKWVSSAPACPMQSDYYDMHKRPVEGQEEFYGWDY